MPAGKNFPVWTDQNEPKGDDPIRREPYLWQHPSAGPILVDPRGGMSQVSQEWFDANSFSAPVAEEQAEAVAGATVADPQPAGQLGTGVTASETNTVAPIRETLTEKNEREQREAAAKGVATAQYQERVAGEGVLGGLSIGDRATVQQMIAEGLAETEEEAAALILAEREKQSLGAAQQEEALSTQDAGTRGVPSP